MGAALVITFREALEAALVVGLLASYLLRGGRGSLLRHVWQGVGSALFLSVVLGGLAFRVMGGLGGSTGELVEGAVGLLAVAILSYMVLWMRRQSRGMGREVAQRAEAAITSSPTLGLAMLSFAMVFREGLEAVLYLATLAHLEGLPSILMGSTIGLLGAGTLGYFTYRGSRLISLSLMFNVTTTVLVIFAAGILGRATLALQVAGLFPETVPAWDTSAFLSETSSLGSVAASLVGYTAQPSVLQVIFSFTFLVVMTFLLGEREEPWLGRESVAGDHFSPLGLGYQAWPYRILRHPLVPKLPALTMLALFFVLFAIGMGRIPIGPFDNEGFLTWGPFSTALGNNLFNLALWVFWLPLVSISAALVGRAWCGNLCPLALAADAGAWLGERISGRQRNVVTSYLRLGWLLPTTFVLVTLLVKSFPFQAEAPLGAMLFLGIFVLALLVSAVFRRGAWCRYFCPIGGWLARVARLSFVALRPNKAICLRCEATPCLTGMVAGRCPALLSPNRLDSNRYCLECWACVKNCPTELGSLQLGLRVPGAELLRPSNPDVWESSYIAALMGMYVAVMGQSVLFPELPWVITFILLIALGAAVHVLVCQAVAWLGGMSLQKALTNVGYVVLPLEFTTALITFGDETLEFFRIMQPGAAVLLGLGFAWSTLLAVSILRHHCASTKRAVLAGTPVMAALVMVLFLWSGWLLSGTVIDLT